ncbi:MAG: molybdopterin molybdotransferase MoeA [Gemmatimonadota bacterium]|nr:molybdopterin molybdotransferase MoeA [Gemmatimonadota bacterium]MDE2870906.1 molybdopterin molybdotransferase MoeA [Gemmatimonadota bacterium]
MNARTERPAGDAARGTPGGGRFHDPPEADWLSCEEALARILAGARPMPATSVPASEALGRSVAETIRARATLPAWRNSAMDGFAVRSGDLPEGAGGAVRLPVAGRSYPGEVPLQGIPPGAAVRVMTGGPVPEGFDTVIRVEHTDGEAEPGLVVVGRTDDLGRHVRAAGRDMRRGRETVPAGTPVHSGSLPVVLASGRDPVSVHRRPRVGVLSSGDELVGMDRFDEVAAGRAIPDTNLAMIMAAVAESGSVPVDLGVAADDPAALRARLEAVGGVDALVTTGGASMGERDLLKRIMLDLGFRLDFWRARVRPGSPLSFGHLPRGGDLLPVFGLPGNPASAFVTFHVFVAPYLRARLGSARPRGITVVARTKEPLSSPPRLTHFLRVRLSEAEWGGRLDAERPGQARSESAHPAEPQRGLRCSLTGPQGSGLVRSLRDADGLAVVAEGVGHVEAGDPVPVLLLPGRC